MSVAETPAPRDALERLTAGYRAPLIVLLAATLLMAPAFWVGHVNGHTSFLNVSWSEGFARRLSGGELYPRWLPEMSRGAGSPVFYFYAPLPFYLAAPFHLVAGPRMAVVLTYWLMLVLSGLSFLVLARAFVGRGAALAGAVVYMAMPYHLLADIWIRTAFGEQAAFIFMPLCLLCAWRLGEGAGYALGLAASFAGLLYSHLPSALAFSPFLVGFCLWTAWRGNALVVMRRAVFAAVLAGGLAAAYLVPAVLLQDMIQPAYWGINRPRDFFLFDDNPYPFVRLLDGYVAFMGVVMAIAAVGLLKAGERRAWPWILAAAAVVFLATRLSGWIWDLSPVFDLVQFPWRTLVLFELSVCMLLALALDGNRPRARLQLALAVAVIVAMTAFTVAGRGTLGTEPTLMIWSPVVEDAIIAARADAMEYLPSCRTPDPADDFKGGSSHRMVASSLAKAGEDVLPVSTILFCRFWWADDLYRSPAIRLLA